MSGVYYFHCNVDGGREIEHSNGDPTAPCPICRIGQLEGQVAAWEKAGKAVVESARQWSSPNYPTFDRIESEHIDTLAALIQGGEGE